MAWTLFVSIFLVSAEYIVNQLNHPADIVISEAVVHRLAIASGLDEFVHTKAGQLLRNSRLPQRENILQIGDRTFSLREQA